MYIFIYILLYTFIQLHILYVTLYMQRYIVIHMLYVVNTSVSQENEIVLAKTGYTARKQCYGK